MPAPPISIQPIPLQRLQRSPPASAPLPSHWKQETSNSTLGSVKGKKCGRMRASRLGAEDRPQHLQQRPLQVGEGDPLGDRQALDLVEHRAVGGVGVAPVDLAGDDR